MTIQDKKQQIIEEYYCNDIHCESYDLYCNNCKNEIKKDIDELERFIRADAIDEFTNALINPNNYEMYDFDECLSDSDKVNDFFKYVFAMAGQIKEKKSHGEDR